MVGPRRLLTLTFTPNTLTQELGRFQGNLAEVKLLSVRITGIVGTPHFIRFPVLQGAELTNQSNENNDLVFVGLQVGAILVVQYAHPLPLREFWDGPVQFPRVLQLGAPVDEAGAAVTFTFMTLVFELTSVATVTNKDPNNLPTQHILNTDQRYMPNSYSQRHNGGMGSTYF